MIPERGFDVSENLKAGSFVRSRCGRDRKRLFLVVGFDFSSPNAPVLIADGRLRSLAKPKRKNPRHLTPVGELTEDDKIALKNAVSDEIIAHIIEKYDLICKQ